MTCKIKMKMGPIEVECEGTEEFVKKELMDLLKALATLKKESGLVIDHEAPVQSQVSPKIALTTGTAASKLHVKSGPDLVMAACAKMFFADQKTSFSRSEILREMKTAKTFYKSSYNSNLSKSLGSLVKENKLNECQSEVYAITEATAEGLKSEISQI